MPDPVTIRLLAHATGGIATPGAWAAIGAGLGLGVAMLINANRRMDGILATQTAGTKTSDAETVKPAPRIGGLGLPSWVGTRGTSLGIVLVASGIIAGYAIGLLVNGGLASYPTTTELVESICVAGTADNSTSSYLLLNEDIQHALADLDPDRTERATRAAQIVQSSANASGGLDPELLQRLAVELADAGDVPVPASCNGP